MLNVLHLTDDHLALSHYIIYELCNITCPLQPLHYSKGKWTLLFVLFKSKILNC